MCEFEHIIRICSPFSPFAYAGQGDLYVLQCCDMLCCATSQDRFRIWWGHLFLCHAWICYAMLCYAMLHHHRFFYSWGSRSLHCCATAMLCAGMRHHVIGLRNVFSAMLSYAMPLYALPSRIDARMPDLRKTNGL